MAKKFVKGTKAKWDTKTKSNYDNSIVFIEDRLEIYSGGKYYSNTNYGVCSTGASTTNKTVSIETVKNYYDGLTINVKFTNTSTASSHSLNVNSLGDAIMIWDNTIIGTNILKSGNVYQFVYDSSGTTPYWRLIGGFDTKYSLATTSTSGLMSYTDKEKLTNIAAGAEVNVQSDWNVTDTTSDAYIKNKPTSMPASDVSSWAKASTKPTYTKSEVGLGNVENTALSTWAGSSKLTTCSQGTFGAAATKSTTTSITSGSSALITSGAVYTGLSGKSDTGHTHDYLPLSGGTVTGTIKCNRLDNDGGNVLIAKVAAESGWTGSSTVGETVVGHTTYNSVLRTKDNLSVYRSGVKYTVLDSGNSSVSLSGLTLTVTINGASQSLTNTNTTYSSLSAASGGTSVSLVTTGEKYIWNNKQAAISDLSTIRTNATNGKTAYGWGNHANAGYAKSEILFNNSSSGWGGDGATVSYPETGVVRGTSSTSSYPRIRHTDFLSISLEVGKPYKLSFYAKSSASLTIKVYIGNNTGSVSGITFGNITTTTSWKKYELFGTALLSSSTADAYGLLLYIATPNVSSSDRYTDFKDIKFEPLSEGERLLKRGNSSTTVSTALYPNDYFVCYQPISSLTISELKQPANTAILASYAILFTPSVSNMTFSYPSTIKWMNGDAPTVFDTTCTYLISIVENLATYQKFK